MIYITGDTHIPIDISKFNNSNFLEQKEMTKDDYVIICGDFGGVWNNSNEELYWQKWLKEKNFTTLFVDGNHENFDLLEKYEIKEWNGGNVQLINDSIIHLMRGQIYNIQGLNFFVMGGAESIDKHHRIEGKSWWRQEIPSRHEFDEGIDNLEKHNWKVDYVISHTCSMRVMEGLGYITENNPLNSYFNFIEDELSYKHWYFGHFHDDIDIDGKHTLLYNKIIPIK